MNFAVVKWYKMQSYEFFPFYFAVVYEEYFVSLAVSWQISCQVLPDDMVALRKALLNMENRDIGCGPVGAEVCPFFL